ncbi:MAG: hypothetical protein AAF328_03100 [Planctomycetota bacterium]
METVAERPQLLAAEQTKYDVRRLVAPTSAVLNAHGPSLSSPSA